MNSQKFLSTQYSELQLLSIISSKMILICFRYNDAIQEYSTTKAPILSDTEMELPLLFHDSFYFPRTSMKILDGNPLQLIERI